MPNTNERPEPIIYPYNPCLVARRALMGKKGGMDYIQDGLVFHLDGINKGATDGSWVDLIGGIVFENHGATFNENNVYIANNRYLQSQSLRKFNVGGTIELCFNNQRQAGSGILFNSGKNREESYIASIVDNSTKIYLVHSTDVSTKYSVIGNFYNSNCIVSASFNNAIINGSDGAIVYEGNNFANRTGYMFVGGRENNYGNIEGMYLGYVYAIRIYNRQLTTAEMLHNQQEDNRRFNLGLNI